MLKRFAYLILRVVDLTLQACTFPNQQRLCYASSPDYAGNAYHLFRHALQTRSGLEHVWLLRHGHSLESRIKKDFLELTRVHNTINNRLRIVHRKSFIGYWLYLTSQHVFHTHGLFEFSRQAIKRNIVSLWHGMPFKRVAGLVHSAPNPYPAFGTVHTATSHFFKYIVASAFNTDPEQVLVCNYPRNDVLTHAAARSYSDQEVREQLQLSKSKKILLWLPTFRTEPSNIPTEKLQVHSFLDDIAEQTLRTLDRAAQKHHATIIIKLHPWDRLNQLDTQKLNYPSFRLIRAAEWEEMQIPLYELLATSDALLTDVSSVLIDYLITGRPIGIIGTEVGTYARGTTFPQSYLINNGCCKHLRDNISLEQFIADVQIKSNHRPSANSEVFMERFDKLGSEHILQHLGL